MTSTTPGPRARRAQPPARPAAPGRRCRRRPGRRTSVVLATLAALVASVLATVAAPLPTAGAATATPAFELPFACGEVWYGATYATHSRYHAIDFNTFNGDAWELGHPVLASAAGTVTASDYQASGAGNRVIVDHGGGWQSVYYHLESRAVSVGQVVDRGAVLGGAGGTPSYPVHLHYEQRKDGVAVPAVFGGVPFTYTEFDIPNGYQGLPVTSGNCGPVVLDPCGAFVDVAADHAFCPAITWLADEGITTGYTDGTFRPLGSISRQALAAFLWRMAGSPVAPAPAFADVPADHAFAPAIGWLVSVGIAEGYEDGTFRPSEPISRQAMAAFLYRFAGSPTGAWAPIVFVDVPGDSPFALPVAWMAAAGVTDGYPDGTFRPAEALSRQAMAAFLQRYADLA